MIRGPKRTVCFFVNGLNLIIFRWFVILRVAEKELFAPKEGRSMPLSGVSAGTQQASLFASGGSQETQSAGSVQQQAAVEVASDQQEQQGQQALQLIQSSQGIGQNVDIKA